MKYTSDTKFGDEVTYLSPFQYVQRIPHTKNPYIQVTRFIPKILTYKSQDLEYVPLIAVDLLLQDMPHG